MRTILKILVAVFLISALISIFYKGKEKPAIKDCGISIGREMLDENCIYQGNIDLPPNWVKNGENLRIDWDDQAMSLNRPVL